jgi:hypothetical protein
VERYVGTKVIQAEPMTRGQYNLYMNWKIPENEKPCDEGYLVLYSDGYISWSPKSTFEEAYKKSGNFDFGAALPLLKLGFKVARTGWNGSGMFAYMVPANSYPAVTDAIKSHFGDDALVPYRAYLALKTAQNDVATWVPSGSDILAEDWALVL